MVARSGRRIRRPVRIQSPSDVLGGHAALPPQRAPVRAASQRIRRRAALRRFHLVRRHSVSMGNAEEPCSDSHQHRTFRTSVLGHRYRRILSDRGLHRRIIRPLVSIRGVLSAVQIARPKLASAFAVGLGRRRRRSERSQQLHRRSQRTAQQGRSSRFAGNISSCATK